MHQMTLFSGNNFEKVLRFVILRFQNIIPTFIFQENETLLLIEETWNIRISQILLMETIKNSYSLKH
jgi:hypothetical protein